VTDAKSVFEAKKPAPTRPYIPSRINANSNMKKWIIPQSEGVVKGTITGGKGISVSSSQSGQPSAKQASPEKQTTPEVKEKDTKEDLESSEKLLTASQVQRVISQVKTVGSQEIPDCSQKLQEHSQESPDSPEELHEVSHEPPYFSPESQKISGKAQDDFLKPLANSQESLNSSKEPLDSSQESSILKCSTDEKQKDSRFLEPLEQSVLLLEKETLEQESAPTPSSLPTTSPYLPSPPSRLEPSDNVVTGGKPSIPKIRTITPEETVEPQHKLEAVKNSLKPVPQPSPVEKTAGVEVKGECLKKQASDERENLQQQQEPKQQQQQHQVDEQTGHDFKLEEVKFKDCIDNENLAKTDQHADSIPVSVVSPQVVEASANQEYKVKPFSANDLYTPTIKDIFDTSKSTKVSLKEGLDVEPEQLRINHWDGKNIKSKSGSGYCNYRDYGAVGGPLASSSPYGGLQRNSSLGKRGRLGDARNPMFAAGMGRVPMPLANVQVDYSSEEEDEDENVFADEGLCEMTAENLFDTLLSRVSSLAKRIQEEQEDHVNWQRDQRHVLGLPNHLGGTSAHFERKGRRNSLEEKIRHSAAMTPRRPSLMRQSSLRDGGSASLKSHKRESSPLVYTPELFPSNTLGSQRTLTQERRSKQNPALGLSGKIRDILNTETYA